jgi:WD40 repeat protein
MQVAHAAPATHGCFSLQVYHTKRMQRVFCVRFSGDGSYVFSGSDDMNVRVWKADASEQLGVTLPREKHKAAYNKALINRCDTFTTVTNVWVTTALQRAQWCLW